ncbi:MAG: serine/threonine-protein kinase, partial [Planctomycetota bacterium]
MSQLTGGAGGHPGRFVAPGLEELAEHFPDLDLQAMLGRGGMGAVYKARQAKLDRVVALKVLPPEVGADPAFAERFLREARTLARLNHPNIVQVYDFGQTVPPPSENGEPRPGLFYFLMEYVEGATLRDVMHGASLNGAPTGGGSLEPAKALEIVRQVCAALQFAHGRGIVHRDVKPENILIDPAGDEGRGMVKIADFGLAKLGRAEDLPTNTPWTLTGARQAMGTPHYMAPEQMRGSRDVDHRADIYSLGVVFYELLTGELPLGRFAPPSQFFSKEGDAKDGGRAARLDDIVLRALEGEPSRRYQRVSDVRAAVDSLGLPSDPATPQVGSLDDRLPGVLALAEPPAAVPVPSDSADAVAADAADPGTVRVTIDGRVDGADASAATPVSPPTPERLRAAEEHRRAASERFRSVRLGVGAAVGGLMAAVGFTVVVVAMYVGPTLEGGVIAGSLFAGVGMLLHMICAASELARRTNDPHRRGRFFKPVVGELIRSLWAPVGIGFGLGAAAEALNGKNEWAYFVGALSAAFAAILLTAARPEPPAWWPGVWDWHEQPPRTPIVVPPLPAVPPVPVEPAAAAAGSPVARAVPRPPVARPGSPAPQAAAGTHDSHLQRAAEVKRKLSVALCLAVGLAGAAATLGAALATAGGFVLPNYEGPVLLGLTACLIGGGVRVLAGAFFSREP